MTATEGSTAPRTGTSGVVRGPGPGGRYPEDAPVAGHAAARAAARAAAETVAELLRSPAHVAETAGRSYATAPDTLMLPGWQPASQLLGHAGIAMLHTALAGHDGRWAAVAHGHLAAAARATAAAGPAGAGDLLVPARQAAAGGGYARLLARAADVHASYAAARLRHLQERRATEGPGLSYLDYDAIAGLARQGRGLLSAAAHGHDRSAEVLGGVLAHLVALARPVRVYGTEVPGWWCAPERYVVPRDREEFPRGDFNVGVAHGVCGPLALLSLARLAGCWVPGMTGAIRTLSDWVRGKGQVGPAGERWPGRVGFDEETGAAVLPVGARSRPGWCYGTAGTAWALHLAGRALDDRTLTGRASAAVRAVFLALDAEVPGEDPGMCHGLAGLVRVGTRMAAVNGDPALAAAVAAAAHRLADGFDSRAAFGYRQPVAHARGVVRIDAPGVIDGAAGVALALLAFADASEGIDRAYGRCRTYGVDGARGTDGRGALNGRGSSDAGADGWDSAFLLC
ncbi:lanthionine synthetase LanC family protein [Streptomyces sp. NPDC058000]|uniref:lanthionine synthetase LanC family protein n=1 Tax=Streptomyces sp. NPDC058000 TaxID=3346299 RepID=UPI0036E39DD1